MPKDLPAAVNATILGGSMAEHRIAAVETAARRRAKEEEEKRRKEEEDEKAAEAFQQVPSPAMEGIHDHHLVVARLSSDEMKNTKLKDILGPLKSVINAALLLVEVPPLHQVREHTAVARYWRGGSVRRLRRIVETLLRERDVRATRN
jgi:glycine/serine hydroxymethyltransferase